ncbi:AAA family ATPase [Kitasatospora sp. NPDC058406]|uniref:AAA family ATPase n=1 Tax=Kitasatospora sp. NPDC058406 TaxID=3346483 RepID=UPI00365AEAD5
MTTVDYGPDLDLDEDTLLRAEPSDLIAEQALLGRLIEARDTRRALNDTRIAPGDFYRPAHQLIHTAITALANRGTVVDPITLTAELQAAGTLTRAGGRTYLGELGQAAGYGATLDWLAARIQDLALRRALARTGAQIRELGLTPQAPSDTSFPGAEYAERAVQLIRDVRDAGRAAEDQPVTDMLDFLQIEDPGHDWVIPGYLERGDRVVWTAGEGGGKSVLLRQIAVTAAAGILPFDGRISEYGPQRVLVLDCENSERQSRRHYRGLINTAERNRTPVRRGHLHIDCKPEGVDLTRGDGRAWLMRRVEEVRPDLLIVGPIYRLHAGDPNSEEHARKVTVALDQARLHVNSAMVLEAHAAKANGVGPRGLAPVGSSLWLRWPEFGMGLRPVEDARSAEEDRARRIIPWRGARDERQWPAFVCQGADGSWPWRSYTPVDADRFTGHSPTGALS